jgi:hypothetical protein
VIALSFAEGTRTTTTVPLTDPESGASYRAADGTVDTLTVRWPDHPSVLPARSLLVATLGFIEHERTRDTGRTDDEGTAIREARTDLAPARVAELTLAREAAMTDYAVALVSAWSFAAPCTPEAVRELFARAPFVYELVIDAAGDAQRFLPDSLRTAAPESAPSSVAPG